MDMEPKQTNPHHLVMGEIRDFLTGEILPDTHDERFRQKIAKMLVRDGGFDKEQIKVRQPMTITAGEKTARIRLDFLVTGGDKTLMMIQYAPGSLVTRRLSNLALSRIIRPYQIPVVVTTNGEDAEIIDGITGTVEGQGLTAVPSRQALSLRIDTASFPLVSQSLRDKASRIAYACQVDGACPCDTDVCVTD